MATAEESREWRLRHPLKQKANELRNRHRGMKLSEYLRLLEQQDDGCAICGRSGKSELGLCVDHDHKTGEIRGLLCHECNMAIGNMDDNPNRLREAADYLEGRELSNE